MLKLDNSLLDELGLGSLPEDQKKTMLQHIYETLELRVGTDLANQMTDQQLEEFEKFIDDGGDANQAQALQWLESNLPNYKQVVNQVFEDLKNEIKSMADQIMASVPTTTPSAPAAEQPLQYQQAPAAGAPQTGYAAPQPTAAQQPQADYYAQQQVAPATPQTPAGDPTQFGSGPAYYGQPTPAAAPAPDPYQQNPVPQGSQPHYDPAPQQGAQQPAAPTQQPYQPPASNGYQYPQQQPPAGPGYQQQ